MTCLPHIEDNGLEIPFFPYFESVEEVARRLPKADGFRASVDPFHVDLSSAGGADKHA